MIAPPTKCSTASSFSVAKKRSANTPMKNGDTMAAMAVVAYAQPICGPVKCRVVPRYVPIVTNHEPQMKYCRNIIAESRTRVPSMAVPGWKVGA